ncbi:MAG TPA: ISKra4 family transposase [Spirochaetia bacterium]|nr:ISKra4 family transposase [Spirochaetia bacterium]
MAFFEASQIRFETIVDIMAGEKALSLAHGELETMLYGEAIELMRILFQDHLTLRAMREQRIKEVVDANGVPRNSVESNKKRTLTTIFGDVDVRRLAYRRDDCANLYPADALLNLPSEQFSHGLRRLAAIEACRGSFGDAVKAIERTTGMHLGKRQTEELTERAATDFDSFYANSRRPEAKPDDVLVLSADGKGIVMRTNALRDATARAAQSTEPSTRLSKGEKKNRKRMAEVGAVYDATPVPRTPEDILSTSDNAAGQAKPAPVAKGKWLTASVVENASTVISQVFDEAHRRDPLHLRTWVVLVDGNNHQIDCINAEAKARKVRVNIVVDFIHVLEYVWKAARTFYNEGDPAAEAWVAEKAAAILAGQASIVAGSIARKATCLKLDLAKRYGADTCHDYILNKRPYLNYHIALKQGWPIATGVIEGAVRYLVKDRMDITGARWGLEGAEAVLKLRAVHKNGDFDAYWSYHIAQERRRVHEARYAGGIIPQVA